MGRKPHPADLANAAIVANAIRFDLALFLGQGRYAKASAHTLADARREAMRLAIAHPSGRGALVYAIDANGRSALVTDDVSNPEKEPGMNVYAKKFNAQRAAKAAGHDPDEIEVVKANDGFTWHLKEQPQPVQAGDAKLVVDASREPRPERRQQPIGKRAAIEAAAREGKLPEPPDFSAETHKRFRRKLAILIEMAAAGDVDGLKRMPINAVSTSPRAMQRYRDLVVLALEAQTVR